MDKRSPYAGTALMLTGMPRPPKIPADLHGRPFLAAEARAMGVTPTMLRGTGWRAVGYGIHVSADVPPSPALTVAAVRLVVPDGAVVSGPMAALLHGCDVRRSVGEPWEVTAPRGVTFGRAARAAGSTASPRAR